MNMSIYKSLILLCSILCMNGFFSQTNVYDVEETTLHLEDTIVYLRIDMIPITGVIQGKNGQVLNYNLFMCVFMNILYRKNFPKGH